MTALCCPHRLLLLVLFIASLRTTDSFACPERRSAFPGVARNSNNNIYPSKTTRTCWSSLLRAGADSDSGNGGGGGAGDRAYAVIVETEINPDRMGEFLALIEYHAKETRKEPGCIRFDVLRSQDADNKFYFYELYRAASAIDHHQKQPHYDKCVEFMASGGVINATMHKTDGEFIS